MKRTGSAVWNGSIKEGAGKISTESGALDGLNYSFAKRFGDEKGTNPEELIGAAHASCFSMALSLMLGQEGFTPDEIKSSSAVTIEQQGGGFTITTIDLSVAAKVPGIDEAKFKEIATKAKDGCPVSKVLNAKINFEAALG
ncbi:OsmC family protein [Hansschlegelia zhihuaiae]|uniref:OsmC family peroxiredoxin n=1 Tax=Hansschlegelia zhihuaiae TaxID=405005 RepID=A0A4Q0MID5_9HYPH|nr:OsmC family protein [Hansschlegelia zhihuaiae]RXF73328.1 OsmC family peroxiredoxin [Hansschlegelia zhihuaiae]